MPEVRVLSPAKMHDRRNLADATTEEVHHMVRSKREGNTYGVEGEFAKWIS